MIKAYEMANLSRKNTQLPFDIWFDSMGKDRKNKHHDLRFKVKNGEFILSVGYNNDGSIKIYEGDTSKFDIRILKNFAERIRILVQMHWNKEITDLELLAITTFMAKNKNSDILTAIDSIPILDEDTVDNIKSNIHIQK